MTEPIEGLVAHRPKTVRLFLDSLEVQIDIGFHDYEIGKPQRLLVSVEVWIDPARMPARDEEVEAWNYDRLREAIENLACSGRFNLQESFLKALFDRVASMAGVEALRVRSVKPDIYPKAQGVGVELASFTGVHP
ncbi:dihydroneopterin aldolase [Sphingomicrobium sediminis]|uniref:Dihydroneopterin aldolase n=1 Tax=Sphingomicrobium sediminis TaxID=2950949 RepID=A0A9X2EEB2_9SPHN|nr:dihydroneopterin aldolase [Sphingomicrobium sediminis]MCM8556453.1 dihydroneopterin aldolase [Sphingomicrobium sediminis]